MKSKQCYAPNSNLERKEENVKLHVEVVNVVNIVVGNNSKSSSSGDDIFASNNDYDKEDSL